MMIYEWMNKYTVDDLHGFDKFGRQRDMTCL